MKCPTCNQSMRPLFLSLACDHCDYTPSAEKLHRGFIVYNPESSPERDYYVFRTRMDAERWQIASGKDHYSVREVYSFHPYTWHLSRGTLRDLVLADKMYQVFKDHRFEPLPERCFLAVEK